MFKAVVMVVGLSLSMPLAADNKSTLDQFYDLKNKAHTQAILGSADLVIGAVLLHSGLKGPKTPALRPTEGNSALTNTVNAVRNSRARFAALKEFQASRGAGLIKSVKLLGSTVFFVDAAGRAFEWYGTDTEPSWSPVYDYLSSATKTPLSEIPEIASTPSAPTSITEQTNKADADLEAELRKKLEGRLAKAMPKYKEKVQSQLAAHEADKKQREELRSAEEKKAHLAEESNRFRIPGDFYKTRPDNDDKDFAEALLFGGDLVGSTLLIKSLLTPEGREAVKAAELAYAKAQELVGVKNTKALSVIPHLKGANRIRYADMLDEAAGKLETQLIMGRKANAASDVLEALAKKVESFRSQAIALRQGDAVSMGTKESLVAMAKRNLDETRALALRTSRGAKLLKGIKVVGTGLLIGDAAGRVFEWSSADQEAKFSPAMTWLMVKSEKPVEQVWNTVGELAVKSKDYFRDQYNKFK